MTSGYSGYKQVQKNSLVMFYVLLVMYYLAKFDVIWGGFWVILKIISANLCKPIYDIINYSTSICPFESGKCGKEGKKITKI